MPEYMRLEYIAPGIYAYVCVFKSRIIVFIIGSRSRVVYVLVHGYRCQSRSTMIRPQSPV